MLTIAIQKSGRLFDDSIALLKSCDLKFEQGRGSSTLRVEVGNFPAEILFLRDDDIPEYVSDGVVDVGIVGENVLAELDSKVDVAEKLNFSKCRLSIAIPKGSAITTLNDLDGKRIATSYPKILSLFLNEKGIKAEIHEISGSVEIAPRIGLAEAICDIVGTGSTLVMNGLSELEVVFRSQAVCIRNSALSGEKRELSEKLLFRIRSVQRAEEYKYILLNAPNKNIPAIIKLLPGLKSPTIIPLADEGWSSIHSVVRKDDFWEKIEALRAQGAEGILVSAIEKMIG